jgi:hypothetical protein
MDAGYGPRRAGTRTFETAQTTGREGVRRLTLSALPGQAISLPSGFHVSTTDFAGAGVDLVLAGTAGAHFVVRNYFGMEPAAKPSASAFAAIEAMLARRAPPRVPVNGRRPGETTYPYLVRPNPEHGHAAETPDPAVPVPADTGAYDLYLFDITNAIWQDRIGTDGEGTRVRYLYRSKDASRNAEAHKRILRAGARYDFAVTNGAASGPAGIKDVLLWRNFSTFLISRDSLTVRAALLVIRQNGLSVLVDEEEGH